MDGRTIQDDRGRIGLFTLTHFGPFLTCSGVSQARRKTKKNLDT